MTNLNKTTQSWLRYWRNSLADAESSNGKCSRKDYSSFLRIDKEAFRLGNISHYPTYISKLFDALDDEILIIKALLRPILYASRFEHSKKQGVPEFVSPIVCPVWISRSGKLSPAGLPAIPRELLSPQNEDNFVIADINFVDEFQ